MHGEPRRALRSLRTYVVGSASPPTLRHRRLREPEGGGLSRAAPPLRAMAGRLAMRGPPASASQVFQAGWWAPAGARAHDLLDLLVWRGGGDPRRHHEGHIGRRLSERVE